MGNRLVCCRLSWTSFTDSEFTNHGAFYPSATTSVQPQIVPYDDGYQRILSHYPRARPSLSDASVQHISEREPEADHDPLIVCHSDQSPSLTSTYNMGNECSIGPEIYREVYEIYDERVHPLFSMSSYCQVDSHFSLDESPYIGLRFQHQILYFLNRLFSSSLLTAESAIVSLVYLERLISSLEMCIVAWSWRRQLLACILIASKVLDDQAVWNADYCQLLKDVHVDDLNDLERHTLSLLQFNTGVPPAVYARYYFDLLTLGEAVALPAINGGERRRMTPRLARRLRVLPISAEARAEYLSAAASSGIAFGGGGILFDLPCSSLVDATATSADATPQQNHQNGCSSQRLLSRQRPHSASPPLSSTQVCQMSTTAKPKTRHHHHHPQAAIESEYERSTSAASTSVSTSSSSSSLTWKSSASASPVSSSSTFSATSGCFQLPTAVSNTAFDPWTTPTDNFHFDAGGSVVGSGSRGGITGRGDDATTNNALFLLQQDSGLY
ncbi:Cyclin-Y [Taenia crassiceps]|uniref:Cyclin-Y n=1 Tax=Taenia crassiceps TaxID=6207 RepID=A0ABR4QIH4_9CEST